MAKVSKLGMLSGTLGNLVFVNSGGQQYVRTRPDKVKQTARSKAAAKAFGLVSNREKQFRSFLELKTGLPKLQYFAARHRARLQKCLADGATPNTVGQMVFGSPSPLPGFEFNPKLAWQRCTNFYPVFEKTGGATLTVRLPELNWGMQIKAPKKATSAVLTFTGICVNLNAESVAVKILSTLNVTVTRQPVPAQEWVVPTGDCTGWILITGTLRFLGTDASGATSDRFAGTYLWAELAGS